MAIATLTIDIVAKLANLQTSFDKAAQLAEKNAKRMDAAFSAAAKTIGGLLGGFTFGALVNGLRDAVSQIDQLAEAAEGLGLGAVALAELRSKAAEAGVGTQQLETAVGKLNQRMAEAAAGNEKSARLFAAMGIEIRNAAGELRSTEDVLGDVADRFAAYGNTAEKGALAARLFGEEVGRKLVAYLSQGSSGLRQFTGLTEDTVREAKRAQNEIDRLATSFERLKNKLIGETIPAVNNTVETMSRIDWRKIFGAVLEAGTPSAGLVEYFRQLNNAARSTVQGRQALEQYAATYDEVDRLLRRSPGQRAPVVPEGEAKKIKDTGNAVKELTHDLERYQAEVERMAERTIAENIAINLDDVDRALAVFQEQADEIARLRELQTGLTATDERRLAAIGRLYELGELTNDQLNRLTDDVYGLGDATAEVDTLAQDLGLTFSSAFEDAIVSGKEFSDVLRGLEQDILRLVTRKLVTEPLAKSITDLIGGATGGSSPFASLFASLFGRASGGSVTGGYPYLVGEKGPEIFVPQSSGRIVNADDTRRVAGRSVVVNITVPANTSAASAQQIGAAAARALAIADARFN